MSRMIFTLALAVTLAPGANAQQPGGPGAPRQPMMGAPRPAAASMLLARTAELKLSDAQVTRLAAVARRTAERRTANRIALDSLRSQLRPYAQGDRPADAGARARAMMDRIRTQEHEDLRDALAVLTPDQQATAWEGAARQRGMGRPGRDMQKHRMRDARPDRRGRGMGPGMAPGMGPGMGPGRSPQVGPRPPGARVGGDSVTRRRPLARPQQ